MAIIRPIDLIPEPSRTDEEKLQCVQKGTHVIREMVLSGDMGRQLSTIWSQKNMFTHYRYGPGGRTGGGVSYEYTRSFKIWQSRNKDEYHVVGGGSLGSRYDPRYEELQKRAEEPLFNLYLFIKKHFPEQEIKFYISKK